MSFFLFYACSNGSNTRNKPIKNLLNYLVVNCWMLAINFFIISNKNSYYMWYVLVYLMPWKVLNVFIYCLTKSHKTCKKYWKWIGIFWWLFETVECNFWIVLTMYRYTFLSCQKTSRSILFFLFSSLNPDSLLIFLAKWLFYYIP